MFFYAWCISVFALPTGRRIAVIARRIRTVQGIYRPYPARVFYASMNYRGGHATVATIFGILRVAALVCSRPVRKARPAHRSFYFAEDDFCINCCLYIPVVSPYAGRFSTRLGAGCVWHAIICPRAHVVFRWWRHEVRIGGKPSCGWGYHSFAKIGFRHRVVAYTVEAGRTGLRIRSWDFGMRAVPLVVFSQSSHVLISLYIFLDPPWLSQVTRRCSCATYGSM